MRCAAANGHKVLDTDASLEAAAAGNLACERLQSSGGFRRLLFILQPHLPPH